MSTAKRVFATESTIINAVTLSGTTESLSSDVDLETNGYEGAHVTIDAAFDASGTQNVAVKIYGSLDGTNYDDEPLFSQEVEVSAGNSVQISLIIKDLAHFKVGVAHVAAEANEATITAKEQSWRWDIS
ncbi:MAG: hypothetical protein JRJ73_08600 [Deltaproteobacteria bacterium]|nr:hypothetical protein [Deltaproteobacteria bacterium]